MRCLPDVQKLSPRLSLSVVCSGTLRASMPASSAIAIDLSAKIFVDSKISRSDLYTTRIRLLMAKEMGDQAKDLP